MEGRSRQPVDRHLRRELGDALAPLVEQVRNTSTPAAALRRALRRARRPARSACLWFFCLLRGAVSWN
jgi:hypothetical protein